MPGTRKLGRPTAHRNAMLRGMVTLLLENGQVETTLTRAKEVRSVAEKMITLGKKNTLASRRAALAYITDENVVTKVFVELAPLYAERNGGYTQIYASAARRLARVVFLPSVIIFSATERTSFALVRVVSTCPFSRSNVTIPRSIAFL